MQPALVRPRGPEDASWHRARIVDFTPELEIVLLLPELPTAAGGTTTGADAAADDETEAASPELIYAPGTELEIELAFPDGLRRLTATVRRLDFSFGGSMRVTWPTNEKRVQRRSYVRVKAAFPATVQAKGGTTEVLEGKTIDVSAGGVRLRLPGPLEAESRVEIQLHGTVLGEQALTSRVVHAEAIASGSDPRSASGDAGGDYSVAFEFVEVNPRLRKRLTQLVFDLQREEKRRRLD